MDSGRHGQSVPGSTGTVQPGHWFSTELPEARKDGSKGRTSEITDLETVFFEKYERRNWSISLFENAVSTAPVHVLASIAIA